MSRITRALSPKWTGIRDKTLWDWLMLLMVPVVVGGFAAWFQVTTNDAAQDREDKRTDRQITAEVARAATQREIEADRARAQVLQVYLDRISELLVKEGLGSAEVREEVKQVAIARTLTSLRDLGQPRKSLLLQFLRASGLAAGDNPSISFADADMAGLDLSQVDIHEINFSKADLRGADLSGADLSGADLSGADLSEADLSGAILVGANLSEAILFEADLSEADLFKADLSEAILVKADLSEAILVGANLSEAILFEADLSGADLVEAKNWSNEQLAEASDLVGAIMPDRLEMTEELWEELKRKYRK